MGSANGALFRWSMRAKLIAAFLTIGLVPIAVVGGMVVGLKSDLEAQVGDQLRDMASMVADKIDRNLFERYGDVQAFGKNTVLREQDHWYAAGGDNAIAQVMNEYVDTYDIYFLTMFVDLKGRLIAVNSRDKDGKPLKTDSLYAKSFADAPWFKALAQGRSTTEMPFTAPENRVSSGTFIEDVHFDKDVADVYGKRHLTLSFSAPVSDAGGQVIGYWTNRADFSLVEEIAASAYEELKTRDLPGAELTMLNADGKVILDYDPTAGGDGMNRSESVILARDLVAAGTEMARRAVEGKTGFLKAKHPEKGIQQLGGFTHLKGALGYPGMNWSVLVRVPEDEANAAATQLLRGILLASLICALATVLLGWWIARGFSKPILAMVEAAKSIATGDASTDIRVRRYDELGELADAFRDMTSYQREMARAANSVGEGDLDVQITPRSESDALATSLSDAVGTLHELLEQSRALIARARDGELDGRIDVARFSGAYADLAGGMNELLVAVAEPMLATREALGELESQNLSVRIEGAYRGEFRRMCDSFNGALDVMEDTIARLGQSASVVDSMAANISDGNGSLASAATQQASSLEQVNGNLEALTSGAKSNAESATSAKQLADRAHERATRGVERMHTLSSAVSEMKQATDETESVVATIQKIAFQTKLLALNAAVEAAHAGDAGRGFAVVAEEVSSLAMRSSEAAQRTGDIIAQSRQRAEAAVELNKEVIESLTEIAREVEKTGGVVTEINEASAQQSRGVSEIALAMGEMGRTTQQNAATTQQTAAATTNLASQAGQMRTAVLQFQLSNDGVPVAAGTVGNDNASPAHRSGTARAS